MIILTLNACKEIRIYCAELFDTFLHAQQTNNDFLTKKNYNDTNDEAFTLSTLQFFYAVACPRIGPPEQRMVDFEKN